MCISNYIYIYCIYIYCIYYISYTHKHIYIYIYTYYNIYNVYIYTYNLSNIYNRHNRLLIVYIILILILALCCVNYGKCILTSLLLLKPCNYDVYVYTNYNYVLCELCVWSLFVKLNDILGWIYDMCIYSSIILRRIVIEVFYYDWNLNKKIYLLSTKNTETYHRQGV